MPNSDLSALWHQRFDDFEHSDLTINAWCAYHDTTYRQFCYWRARLKRTTPHKTPTPKNWVAVTLTDPPPVLLPATPSGLTVHIAGAEIKVTEGFDPALLRQIVAALREGAC